MTSTLINLRFFKLFVEMSGFIPQTNCPIFPNKYIEDIDLRIYNLFP